jgi:hypothetical protein
MLAHTLSRDHVEVWLCSVIKTKECTKRVLQYLRRNSVKSTAPEKTNGKPHAECSEPYS